MLYKSLILGVLFSIGVFAGKSGIGLAYLLGRTPTWRGKAIRLLGFALLYGLVFALAAWGLRVLDPLAHLESIQRFLQSGMQAHLLMAGVMIAWGLALLRKRHQHGRISRGWLLLTLPCPVCATVIVFSLAFGLSLFPDQFAQVAGGLYLSFLVISLVVMGLMLGLGKMTAQSAENLLGGAMVLLGAYFLLSMAILPQFADVDKIYRMAHYQAPGQQQDLTALLPLVVLTLLTFMAGFGRTHKKIRSSY
jgi:predicted transporter